MMDRLFVIAILMVAEGCMLWLVIDALLTKGVTGKTSPAMIWGAPTKIRRANQPIAYWTLLGLYATSAVFIAVLLVFLIENSN